MFFAIDRFEDGQAVLVDDNEKTCTVDRALLPAGVQVGDVLKQENGTYIVDREETASRRAYIRQLEEKLRAR